METNCGSFISFTLFMKCDSNGFRFHSVHLFRAIRINIPSLTGFFPFSFSFSLLLSPLFTIHYIYHFIVVALSSCFFFNLLSKVTSTISIVQSVPIHTKMGYRYNGRAKPRSCMLFLYEYLIGLNVASEN